MCGVGKDICRRPLDKGCRPRESPGTLRSGVVLWSPVSGSSGLSPVGIDVRLFLEDVGVYGSRVGAADYPHCSGLPV